MSDVVIVGGGIVGLACAYELAKDGASVTLLEYGKTGMQATNAAAGMLAPLVEAQGPGPMFDACVRALREMPADVANLERQGGFETELRLDGCRELEQHVPPDIRHSQVDDHHIEMLAPQLRERGITRLGDRRLDPGARECDLQRAADRRLVVHHQHAGSVNAHAIARGPFHRPSMTGASDGSGAA